MKLSQLILKEFKMLRALTTPKAPEFQYLEENITCKPDLDNIRTQILILGKLKLKEIDPKLRSWITDKEQDYRKL